MRAAYDAWHAAQEIDTSRIPIIAAAGLAGLTRERILDQRAPVGHLRKDEKTAVAPRCFSRLGCPLLCLSNPKFVGNARGHGT